MTVKRIICAVIVAIICIMVTFGIWGRRNSDVLLRYDLTYVRDDYVQVYYTNTLDKLNEELSEGRQDISGGELCQISSVISKYTIYRIDFGDLENQVNITNIVLSKGSICVPLELSDIVGKAHIGNFISSANNYSFETDGADAQLIFDLTEKLQVIDEKYNGLMNSSRIVYLAVSVLAGLLFYILYGKIKVLVQWTVDILKSRPLIIGLAVNDFKMRYASSYLGAIWAFVQPVVIVTIYVVVFGYGFRSMPVSDIPFALWLTAGIIPWFFFQDAWTGATNSLLDYSYLVKKVVFKISVLPVVKIVSAIFVHFFFVILAILLYLAFGYRIHLSILQTLYYTFCILVFVLGLSYITSACVVFFKDIGQIVMVILQFGIWVTPIMWQSTMFGPKAETIIKLNPMYYVVDGYRDSFYSGIWFWEKLELTIYFWATTSCILAFGIKLFRSLEKHFADVL